MTNTFNSDFLVGKLAQLTGSKRKIESLSQWCISHMNKAKEIVELWSRQFHSSPREQRLAFLFLASDIIQNSRRKGAEFVLEFWEVLPNSIHDVIEHGEVSQRDDALRLIDILVDRSVFGSRSQILKEEISNKQLDNIDRNLQSAGFEMRPPGAKALDKIVSGFQVVYGNQLDEDDIFRKCRNAINFVEKVNEARKEVRVHDGVGKDLKEQHAILRGCMEQLKAVKSSRQYLATLLREALQEQENKLNQVGDLFQEAYELLAKHNGNGCPTTRVGQSHEAGGGEQFSSVIFTHVEKPNENPAASAVVAGTAPTELTSLAQMPTCLHSPFASQGVVGSSDVQDSSNDDLPRKIARIDNDHIFHVPPPPPPPTPPSPPPPPPPLIAPYQVPQYTPMPPYPYGYHINSQAPLPPPYPPRFITGGPPASGGYDQSALPTNAYYSNPTEGGFYGQPPSLTTDHMDHDQ